VGEHQSLAAGDHVVIDAGTDQNLQVGDWFTIIRKSPLIHHPVTTRAVGMRVTTLGYATAVRVQPSVATLRLVKTFDAVEVGDQVIQFVAPQPQEITAAVSPSARAIRGFIVATKDDKVSVGKGDIVYLDRGKKHGVRVGDRFNVFQIGDTVRHPITHRLIHLPRRVLGELAVLDVRDHTATALVTASRRELSAGAPVELRAIQAHRLMEAKATEVSPKRTAQTELVAQVKARLAQLVACLEAARQAIRAAEAAGATRTALAPARSALAMAEQKLEQAQASLARGDIERARRYLEAAQADCLTARERSQQARSIAVSRTAPERYTVQRGDTLWGISAQETIYHTPFMWPMIYKANRQQIDDPDLIFPKQVFTIPRNYTQEEAHIAIERARRRGPWRLGDGADTYILEGVRR
jgi:nucleoid-associated protein YgaU